MKIDIEELKEELLIDKHSLDECIIRQPSLFYQVSEEYSKALDKRDGLKESLAISDSCKSAELRNTFEASGVKFTESKIVAEVQISKEHMEAHKAYLEARLQADMLAALKDAFNQRSFMLRDMVSLYTSEYFTSESITSGEQSKNIRANGVRKKRATTRRTVTRD